VLRRVDHLEAELAHLRAALATQQGAGDMIEPRQPQPELLAQATNIFNGMTARNPSTPLSDALFEADIAPMMPNVANAQRIGYEPQQAIPGTANPKDLSYDSDSGIFEGDGNDSLGRVNPFDWILEQGANLTFGKYNGLDFGDCRPIDTDNGNEHGN
jgi:hypothetical protein